MKEFQLKSKLTPQEIDEVYRILNANEMQAQTLHANVNKENITSSAKLSVSMNQPSIHNTPVKDASVINYVNLDDNENNNSLNDTNNENLDTSDMDKTLVTDTSLN